MNRFFRNTAILAGVLSAFTAAAQTQQGTLNKQVEVTRAYEPTVGSFPKLNIEPIMTDTVQLRPEFRYNIGSHPLSYSFGTTNIRPATINTIGSQSLYPFYIKAGAGYPLQSVFQAAAHKKFARGSVGILADHYGQWADIENVIGIKEKADQTFNNINLWGERNIGRGIVLDGEIGYDYNKVTRYGYDNLSFGYGLETPIDYPIELGQSFNDFHAKVSVGNPFERSEKLNFRVNAGIDYFNDKFDYGQTLFNGGFQLGKMFSNSGITVNGDFTAASGLKNLSDYKDNIAKVGLAYIFDNGDLRFSLGSDFGFLLSDTINNKFQFLPRFTIEKSFMDGGLVPFIDINFRVQQNNYRRLVEMNPYMLQGSVAANSVYNDFRAGIKGHLSPSVRYKLYGGFSKVKNMPLMFNLYNDISQGNLFVAINNDVNIWTAGLDLNANILNVVELDVKGQLFGYDADNMEYASGLPEYTAEIGVKYAHRNKLYLGLNADVLGKRTSGSIDYDAEYLIYRKNDAEINLKFTADYFISQKFGIFLNINNILNQELSIYNNYPMLGIGAVAGVKISF